MNEFNGMRSKPVYDEKTGKLLGWKLIYLVETNGFMSPVAQSRFFKEKMFRSSYCAMCRFKTKLLKQQNENTK